MLTEHKCIKVVTVRAREQEIREKSILVEHRSPQTGAPLVHAPRSICRPLFADRRAASCMLHFARSLRTPVD